MKQLKTKTKKSTKKENMFCNPEAWSPERIFMKIFSVKHILPSSFDRLTLLFGSGDTFSNKRKTNVRLSFKLKDFYRLLKMKNLPRGRTTSREATPLGDPRGVPKQFSTFWRFSKRFPKRFSKCAKSLPICLEGFRNRSKHSSQSVLQRIEIDNSVNILVLKTKPNTLEIQLNLDMAAMENSDHPLLEDLFSFLESEPMTFSDEDPTLDLDELWSMLPSDTLDNSNTVSGSHDTTPPGDDFLYPDLQSTLVDSSGLSDQADISPIIFAPVIPATHSVTSNNSNLHLSHPQLSPYKDSSPSIQAPQASPQLTVCSPTPSQIISLPEISSTAPPPLFTVSTPAPTPAISLPQYVLQVIPGTSQYQLIPIELETPQPNLVSPTLEILDNQASPQVLDNNSPSSSMLSPASSSSAGLFSPCPSVSSSTPSGMDEYQEMRRKNNLACENYRKRKKTKQELADEELKILEHKNEVLSMKVRQMESIIKDIRGKVITGITQPRGIKREGENGFQYENKKRRCEP